MQISAEFSTWIYADTTPVLKNMHHNVAGGSLPLIVVDARKRSSNAFFSVLTSRSSYKVNMGKRSRIAAIALLVYDHCSCTTSLYDYLPK